MLLLTSPGGSGLSLLGSGAGSGPLRVSFAGAPFPSSPAGPPLQEPDMTLWKKDCDSGFSAAAPSPSGFALLRSASILNMLSVAPGLELPGKGGQDISRSTSGGHDTSAWKCAPASAAASRSMASSSCLLATTPAIGDWTLYTASAGLRWGFRWLPEARTGDVGIGFTSRLYRTRKIRGSPSLLYRSQPDMSMSIAAKLPK
mmetsp:Transcript_2917/g.10551  ORF Transcript_2917/g.10551 Transcript_2917/m.10551 type:complete len:201 (+) Transcript_2917:2372-2974(+)